MRARSIASLLLGAVAALLSATGGCGAGDVAVPRPATHGIYGPSSETLLVPFPSDRFTVRDAQTRTGLRVDLSLENTADTFVAGYPAVVDRLNELDGFSTAGGFAVGFDAPIDAQSFAGPQGGTEIGLVDADAFTRADAKLLLVDIDAASPERGRTFGLLPRYYAQAADGFYPHDEYTIVARPLVPLSPGRRYMFVVTRRLLDARGEPVTRTDESRSLLEDAPADAYAREVQGGLDVLEEQVGVPREDVVVASAFTTGTVTADLDLMARRVRAALPPSVTSPWEVETLPTDADPRVRFKARFLAPEYRDDATHRFVVGADGVPEQVGWADLEVFLAFSDRDAVGRRPVVIYQHGLGGDKDGSWGTAQRLAELGAAVIAIDSPEHGARGNGPGSTAGSIFSFFGIDQETAEFDIGRARDNFRQMALDQLELVRLVESLGALDVLPVGAPDGVPDLDVSRLLYIGHSFGSVQGPTIFALAPEIRGAVWNVGGNGLMTLLEDSGTFSLLVDGIKPATTTDGELARFFSATQAIVDPGDGINYARFAVSETFLGVVDRGPRSVLLQEVVDDTIVPNSTSEATARAAGLVLVDPVRPFPGIATATTPLSGQGPGGSTAAVSQFAVIEGGKNATHGELIFSPEAQQQYVELFRSVLANDGVGTVVSPGAM